jgi:hypothetical protein
MMKKNGIIFQSSSPTPSLKSDSITEINLLLGDMQLFLPNKPVLRPIDHNLLDEVELAKFQLEEEDMNYDCVNLA